MQKRIVESHNSDQSSKKWPVTKILRKELVNSNKGMHLIYIGARTINPESIKMS